MARRYASRKRSYGRKTKRGAVRKRSYRRKSSGARRVVRAPRQASGASMNGYSVFNMPFSSYGKGNSTGIGLAINAKANARAQSINTRLGKYYSADAKYRAQVADQQKALAIQQAKAKRIADANFGVDLYNEIGTGLAGLANMIVPGLGVPIQAVVSGTTPAFRQLAGGDQTFRPRDIANGITNFAPAIPWANAAIQTAANAAAPFAIAAYQNTRPAVLNAYRDLTGLANAQYGRVRGHVMDKFNFGPATDSQRQFSQRLIDFTHQPSSEAYKNLWAPTTNRKSIEWINSDYSRLNDSSYVSTLRDGSVFGRKLKTYSPSLDIPILDVDPDMSNFTARLGDRYNRLAPWNGVGLRDDQTVSTGHSSRGYVYQPTPQPQSEVIRRLEALDTPQVYINLDEIDKINRRSSRSNKYIGSYKPYI